MSDLRKFLDENHKKLLESGQIPKVPCPPVLDPENLPRIGVLVRLFSEYVKKTLLGQRKGSDDHV